MQAATALCHFVRNLVSDILLPFPLLGVFALMVTYVLLSNLLVDFICPLDETEIIDIDPSPSAWSLEDEASPPGMSLEELQETPCFDYGGFKGARGGGCAICLDGFESGERCRIFPVCNHVFHRPCIDLWLAKRLTCPTCRSPFRTSSIV